MDPMQRPSVPPGPTDDRTTERRLIPSVPRPPSLPAESSRDVAQEDFLFHLYRGSELLQENRVLEAKEELEFALTVQPRDPKGQDLLGAVYFRLGLYPRAIQIYENLEAQFPRDASIKINLALCYLKTGQPEPARRVLQDTVRLNPSHKRAWGYLGLALRKLGDLDAAQIAFERGGHPMMAKRLHENRRASMPVPSEPPPEIDEGVRSVAETAFSELDSGELRFSLAAPAVAKPLDGPWHTLELGGDAVKPRSPYAKTLPPPSVREQSAPPSVHEQLTALPPPLAVVPRHATPPPPPTPTVTSAAPSRDRAAPSLAPSASRATTVLALDPGESIALHPSGALLARTSEERPFAGRLDAIRVVAGAVATRVLHRRSRDADTKEVLGGLGSPLVRIAGAAQVVLGARAAHRLELLTLQDGLAFVREDALLGFELALAFENGRLALEAAGEGARASNEGVHVVQLRGSGALVLELAGTLASVPCTPGLPLLVRREWIVGWLGRLVPRAPAPSESPSGQRGLVGFSGEGTVLVCAS
jgi:hypothetical protein